MGMSGLLNAFGLAQQQDQQNTQNVINLQQQQRDLGNQAVQANNQVGADQAAINQAKLDADKRSQDAARQVASSLGANPDEANFQMANLGQIFTESQQRAQALSSQIAQKSQVGFLDSPLEWLGNQFTLPSLVRQHDAYATQGNEALSTMNAINSAVQNNVAAQQAITQRITVDTMAKQLDMDSAMSKLKSIQLQSENIGRDIDGIKFLMANTDRSLGRFFQLQSAENQQAQLGIAQAHLSLARQEFAQKTEEWTVKMQNLREEQQGKSEFAAAYNVGAKSLGLPEVSTPQLIQMTRFGGTKMKQLTQQMVDRGFVAAADPSGKTMANSAADTIAVLHATNAPMVPEQRDLKTFLFNSHDIAAASPAATKLGLDAAVNGQVITSAAQMQANVNNTGPKGIPNIYSNPSPQQLLTAVPDVAKSWLGQQLAAQAAAGVTIIDPNVLMNAGYQAVSQGKLTPQDFITQFAGTFSAIKMYNNTVKQYPMYGIPKQEKVNLPMDNGSGGLFKRTNTFDASDPNAVTHFFATFMANKSRPALTMDQGNTYQNLP